jgi:hypothetical protein
MRRRRPRLPWKRGPAAWKIWLDADEIKIRISAEQRNFFSLRKAARLLNVSTQPVRDWIRLGYLKREGPRGQIARAGLERFVGWFEEKAKSFEMNCRRERFHRHLGRPPHPFEKLRSARFVWPKGRTSLTPKELSSLIPCHPSLVVKAIHASWRLGRRRTPRRCKITRRAWSDTFFFTIITKPRMPSLPHGDPLSTAEVANHLQACGMDGVDQLGVRKLIKEGVLEGLHRSPRGAEMVRDKGQPQKISQNFEKTT